MRRHDAVPALDYALAYLVGRAAIEPDVIDQAIERIRSAATAAARSQGDATIARWLNTVADQLAPNAAGVGTLSDGESVATKAARDAIDDVLSGRAPSGLADDVMRLLAKQ